MNFIRWGVIAFVLSGAAIAQPQHQDLAISLAEGLVVQGTRQQWPNDFSVQLEDSLLLQGTRRQWPHDFTVSFNRALEVTGTRITWPKTFSVTDRTGITVVGTGQSMPNRFSVTDPTGITVVGTGQSMPDNFSVTDSMGITIVGTGQSMPNRFSVTDSTGITVVGTGQSMPNRFSVTDSTGITVFGTSQSTPNNFSVTDSTGITVVGTGQSMPNNFSVTAKQPLLVTGTSNSTANSLWFMPLVSLVQVDALSFNNQVVNPFDSQEAATKIANTIATARESTAASGNNSGGSTTPPPPPPPTQSATPLPLSGPLPINSTAGRINLDYNPTPGNRSLRLFNETSTGQMPIRRILTTDGVSQGAVQIRVDDDFFTAVSRSNGSDVLSTPGTQILVVRDFADNSFLQIRIQIGPTNFFGDHEVIDLEGYYCGFSVSDCPL